MKHFLRLSALSLLITALTLSNCGKESDPGPKTKVEFKLTASSAQEGQNVTVEFSVPLPSGVSVTTANISLSGTATETTDYTYTISNTGITFSLIDDGLYDPDETIVVTLLSVGGNGELGTTLVHTVTITETPLVIGLNSSGNTRTEGFQVIVSFVVNSMVQALPDGVVPTYSWGGTATLNEDYTYELNDNRFLISVLTDELYDPNETIVLTLTEFTGNAVTGGISVYTLSIIDEDDAPGTLSAQLKIDLSWETEDGTAGDVDMDLLVWRETSPGVYSAQGALWSASPGAGFESTSISALETDGNWAFSYVYWEGSSDDLKVKVDFRSHRGNLSLAAGGVSNRASFNADYTSANKNPFENPYSSPDVVAQTLVKAGSNYNEVSIITVEESGSRTKPLKFILDDEARRIIEKKFQRKTE